MTQKMSKFYPNQLEEMTADEFRDQVIKEPLGEFSSKILLERTPFIFGNDTGLFFSWKHMVSDALKIDASCIVFTGSSCVGISLNPKNNLRDFSQQSDIDLAIISEYYFTTSWRTLRNLGAKRFSYNQETQNAIDDHRTRLIYWGTIATDKILHVLPFHKEWSAIAEKMKSQNPTENRTINFRIYKDFESLRAYHVDNLKKFKNSLLEGNQNGVQIS